MTQILNYKIFLCFALSGMLMSFTSCSSQNSEGTTDKILIDIGDSLTKGSGGQSTSMSSVTSTLLGEQWVVKNMGVGGENTLTIGARYGAIPMYIKESIIIPKDGSTVEIPLGLFSTYNNSKIKPLIQGDAGINPCFVDSLKCTLSRVENSYFIKRNDIGTSDHLTKPNTTIETSLSKQTKGIATIFIGQNGGYESPQEFLEQIDLFVAHKGDSNFIIITSHGNGSNELVAPVKEKYGDRVIDFKKYMTTKAISDAIEYGLLPDDGSFPTNQDIELMRNNKAPASLLIDIVHLNPIGYTLLGKLRYKKGLELGYW